MVSDNFDFLGLAVRKAQTARQALPDMLQLSIRPLAVDARERTGEVFKVSAHDQMAGPALRTGKLPFLLELPHIPHVGTRKMMDELAGRQTRGAAISAPFAERTE
jgi:hypothetical protein